MAWVCPSCGFSGNDDALIRCTCGYEQFTQESPQISSKNMIVAHFVALLLLIIGMCAGYYWMPVLGVLIEIVIWLYVGFFMDTEKVKRRTRT
jgi:hypothetical protein